MQVSLQHSLIRKTSTGRANRCVHTGLVYNHHTFYLFSAIFGGFGGFVEMVTDRRTDKRTDGRTWPLIERQRRIWKTLSHELGGKYKNERVNEWAQQSARVKEALLSKQMSEQSEGMSEQCLWMSEWMFIPLPSIIPCSSFEKSHSADVLDIVADMDECNALWSRSTKNRDGSTGQLTRPFTRLLAQLTHLLAPRSFLRSFVCSLARSLILALMGKWMIRCLKMTWFCSTVQWWHRRVDEFPLHLNFILFFFLFFFCFSSFFFFLFFFFFFSFFSFFFFFVFFFLVPAPLPLFLFFFFSSLSSKCCRIRVWRGEREC